MENTSENVNIDKCSMVALDSNVFIFMARTANGSVHKKKGKLAFFDSLRVLKKLNQNGHLIFVITPTVLNEISEKLDRREKAFLRHCCLVAIPKNKEAFAIKAYELAKKYQKSGVMPGTSDAINPDSIIMAEASILGLNLITANERDFIEYGRDEQSFDKKKKGAHKRACDIKNINMRSGCRMNTPKGSVVYPTAYSIQSFLDLYRTEIFPIKFMKEFSYSSEL